MVFSSYITIIAAVQGLFFSIVLLTIKNANKRANRTFCLLLLSVILGNTMYIHDNPITFYLHYTVIFFGPLLFSYVNKLTSGQFKGGFPGFYNILFTGVFILLLMANHIVNREEFSQTLIPTLCIIQSIYTFFYCIYILYKLKTYRKNLKENFSNTESINLKWISTLLWLFLIHLIFIAPFNLTVLIMENQELMDVAHNLTPAVMALSIFILGFSGIKYNEAFHNFPGFNADKEPKDRISTDIRTSELLNFMDRNKPWLSTELTLDTLSQQSEIPAYLISKIINNDLKKNFFDFINTYRVEYFNTICLLHENRSRSILDLALESGFSSKSTFNLRYKSIMGITPSRYRRNKGSSKE